MLAGGIQAVRRRGAAILAALVLALAPAAAVAGDGKAPVPVAVSAKLEQSERSARLTFVISRPVHPVVTPLERPDRIVLDLPEVNFQVRDAATPSRTGLVSSFRQGLFAPGKSRIVIDLRRPALVASVTNTPLPDGLSTAFTIELNAADREAFAKAVKATSGPADEPIAAAPAREPASAKPLVVIDPGHGGVDPGAMADGGINEKDIVFTFAQKLKARLEATGRYRVMMTRDSDVFVSLGERVRIARRAQADLFVSIHADTLSASPKVRGMTVYTGSERATDTESQELADKENRADALAGAESPETVEEVSGILADLTRRETRLFSQHIAKQVVQDAGSAMRLNKNPHRSAGFRVLTAPDVASILIELGYLSSSEDIALLQSDAWRDKATGAIASAIGRYFAQRTAVVRGAAVSP